MTDKLTQLTAAVAKLLDGVVALPADADREHAAKQLAHELVKTAYEFAPGSYTADSQPLSNEQIAEIRAANPLDANTDFDSLLDGMDLSGADDIAAKVIDREVSFEADNDCGDACKI